MKKKLTSVDERDGRTKKHWLDSRWFWLLLSLILLLQAFCVLRLTSTAQTVTISAPASSCTEWS